ncbi:DUF6682 family protein [Chromohalobacter sp. 296-RDG]|uniref:phage adaptor protein n=1 Tax=Chromohalobacter sp. 296-RDG TaxID=2994062 RepID=UPI00246989F7|nr:DUF6682 family protein [Chromohalobacter sp. 296-RDG]
MAVTTVGTVISNAKLVLQEITSAGTRWTNEELIGWLNEFYQAAVQLKPDAFSMNTEVSLAEGTRQQIPADGLRLIDVMRNTVGSQMAVMVTTRRALDSTRRNWHSDPASLEIEQYVFDDLDPDRFYVYPPAKDGAKLEIIYSAVPTPHKVSDGLDAIRDDAFKLNDAYAPVATDYILYRAYSKDAEHSANLSRAQMHRQSYMQQMQGKGQVDSATSPNAPDGSTNPQGAA